MANRYTQSKNEIVKISKAANPEKIINEGDSLKIGAEIHSFYWPWDGTKKHDYEPVAIKNDCGFSRFHYHGLFVWQDPVMIEGKPIVSFFPVWNTPKFCTSHKPFFKNILRMIFPRQYRRITTMQSDAGL